MSGGSGAGVLGASNGRSPSLNAPDVLLATKLSVPPQRPNRTARARLIERLMAGARGTLTLVVAPAGYGKTTLLSEWCAALAGDAGRPAVPVAWLGLDAGDNDLVRFLRYVAAALRQAGAPVGTAGDSLAVGLINDLTTLPGDVVLVLDDYQVIEAPDVHQAVAFLLEHLPPRVHVVIATRADPPLPLARLRARGQLAELRAANLRCTVEEAAAFLEQTMGLALTADEAAVLEGRTEGWIAGLQLAALSLQGREEDARSAAIAGLTGAHRYIFDYLAEEVFVRQPEDVRRFLLHTSVLDRLCGSLCEAVVGDGGPVDGQGMLERLEAANLFVVSLDDGRVWYRYHQLFTEFLQERLRHEQPALIPELHAKACHWHEERGLLAEAAEHALAADDAVLAARLVEQATPAGLWQRGEVATVLRWLERVPSEVVRRRPRLCVDLAWALLLSARVDEIGPWLDAADVALASPPDEERALRAQIAAMRAEQARQGGESAEAVALARQALADLPPDDQRLRAVVAVFLGNAQLSSGDAVAATEAYREAVRSSQAVQTVASALIGSGRLVTTQAARGQLHQAADTYRETLDLAARHGMMASPTVGGAQVGMAEVLREWNDLDQAEALAREGIGRCRAANGLAQMALDGALTLARLVQARGDCARALGILQEIEDFARERHLAQSAERIGLARARLWLTATPPDVAAARRWAAGREAAWRSAGALDYVGLLERVTLARLRLVEGRRAEAAALLRRLLTKAEAGGLLGCVLEILALQARLAHEQGDEAQAVLTLGRALTLAEPEGYVRVFVDEGAPMVALLRQAQARGAAPAYVGKLLEVFGSVAAPPAATLIEPLTARERELLRLLAAGLSTAEIAAQLVITVGTARLHLKHIYQKLDVHSRVQAVERARALRLV